MFRTQKNPRSLAHDPGLDSSRFVIGSAAYTLLRMAVGVIMIAHGSQKLLDLEAWEQQVASLGIPLPALASILAVGGELLGGLGLLVGFITPLAAFGVLSVMVTAILTVHLSNGLFHKNGGFEYPLTLACAAVLFMVNGAGPLSVDGSLARWQADRRRLRNVPRTMPADSDGTDIPSDTPPPHPTPRGPLIDHDVGSHRS